MLIERKVKKLSLLISGIGLATGISSCNVDISIGFNTFASLVGNYSGYTAGSVSSGGGSMVLTATTAKIVCPSGYVIPVKNVKPSDGSSSLVTCQNAGGCDQIAFAALVGSNPFVTSAPANQGDPGGVANNDQSVVGADCVPKSQLSYWS